MAQSRRRFLRIAGTGAVILAAGAGGFVLTRRPDKALRPWEMAGEGYEDPRLYALSYAILAPNPHNMQPWLVSLEGADAFTLSYDLDKMLRDTDPFDRQIVIGLGCFLELMRLAALERGFVAEIDLFPEGMPEPLLDGRPIARVRFVPAEGKAPDALFASVLDRHSNKSVYDTGRPVERETSEALLTAAVPGAEARVIDDPALVAALRELTWQGHVKEVSTPRVFEESVRLMRIGKAEINANPDGLELRGPMLEALYLTGLMKREDIGNPDSAAFRQGLEMFRPVMMSAMAYVTVTTVANTRADQIAAGRNWVRLNLKAAELGLGLHPVSQLMQEYPEMAELRAELQAVLGVAGRRVQMLGRLGYGPAAEPTARWPLEAKLV